MNDEPRRALWRFGQLSGKIARNGDNGDLINEINALQVNPN